MLQTLLHEPLHGFMARVLDMKHGKTTLAMEALKLRDEACSHERSLAAAAWSDQCYKSAVAPQSFLEPLHEPLATIKARRVALAKRSQAQIRAGGRFRHLELFYHAKMPGKFRLEAEIDHLPRSTRLC